jgi:hypothetical protein
MAYQSFLGSQVGTYHLTRLALSEVFGSESMVIKSHSEEDLKQALDFYCQQMRWTYTYARLFSFKASASFD